jgi:transposase-like protein
VEMNLADLVEQFGSNDRCRDYLEHLRWPEGVECPKCGSKSISRISTRKQFDCNSCRCRFSVLAGTIFQDSKLALWKWFAAVYLMCESKKGISALQLKRMLKIGSYETAWYLCHRIRAAMEDQGAGMLSGVVELDETYIGGKARGRGRGYKKNKAMVLGAVERGGRIRLQVAPNEKRETLRGFAKSVIHDDAEAIYTDEEPAYGDLNDWNTKHERVKHRDEEWVRGLVHTNTVESAWSLLDRAILGSYHKLSHKHLQAYCDEFAFRFNNRENPYLFRDTLLKLVEAEALTYDRLTKAA